MFDPLRCLREICDTDQIDHGPRPASDQCLQRRDTDLVPFLRQLEYALIFGRHGLKTGCQLEHRSNNFYHNIFEYLVYFTPP